MPLSRALGVTEAVSCPTMSFVAELFTTTRDWRISSLGWTYTLFFVMLGSSAAIWGGWLEGGPPQGRRCFCVVLVWRLSHGQFSIREL
jgi:hypothetical protein